MYTLKIDDDNNIITTKREVIMQRSSNANTIQILVPRYYNTIDLSQCQMLMEYWLPVSKVYRTVFLTPNSINYKEMDYLEYLVPCTTEYTAEAGDIHIHFTFYNVELSEDGASGRQTVRKTNAGVIHITPISAWSDIIPDEALTALDQRVIALQTAIRQIEALTDTTISNIPTDLALDTANHLLHLVAEKGKIGSGVDVNDLTQAVAVTLAGEDPDGTPDGVVHLEEIPGMENQVQTAAISGSSVTDLDTLMN